MDIFQNVLFQRRHANWRFTIEDHLVPVWVKPKWPWQQIQPSVKGATGSEAECGQQEMMGLFGYADVCIAVFQQNSKTVGIMYQRTVFCQTDDSWMDACTVLVALQSALHCWQLMSQLTLGSSCISLLVSWLVTSATVLVLSTVMNYTMKAATHYCCSCTLSFVTHSVIFQVSMN